MLDATLSDRATRVMLLLIALIVTIGALRYAEPIMSPFVLAVVLGIVCSPLSEKMVTLGFPRVIAATLTLVMTCAIVVVLFVMLEPLLTLMVERLPRLKMALESWIDSLSELLRGIETISEEIEETVGGASEETPTNVPSISDAIWLAPNLGARTFIFIGTFFFFILTREDLYSAAGSMKERLFQADAQVSRYFAAVTLVNIGVGVATAIAMMAIGIEYPLLWGLAAGVLNYILYLGPLIIIFGLLIAGLIQFWDAMAFLPPAAFMVINFIEAQFATPMFVGQHIRINPLVVFVAIVFGLWLWGPIGAIVALPVIVWLAFILRSDAANGSGLRASIILT